MASTIVGETTLIKGNLQGDEDLNVHGRVEGAVNLSRTLIVENSGIVKAEVSVRNCIVSGVVVGNITATDAIELTHEARVVGDLTAPRVIIVDGASFRGRVDMGEGAGQGERKAPSVTAGRSTGSTPGLARTSGATRTPSATRSTVPGRATPPPPPRRPEPRQEVVEATAAPARKAAAKKAPAKKAPASPPRPSSKKKKVKVRKKTGKR